MMKIRFNQIKQEIININELYEDIKNILSQDEIFCIHDAFNFASKCLVKYKELNLHNFYLNLCLSRINIIITFAILRKLSNEHKNPTIKNKYSRLNALE